MKKENLFYPKVLFTTGLPRTFRASNIAHLYEIAQKYPVVLLSEELDSETEKLLQNKELFPKLEEIIPYRQFSGEKTNLFSLSNNRYYYQLARDVIERYKPDIIMAGDTYLFQLYLSKLVKKINPNCLHISIQGGLMGEMKQVRIRTYLISTYLKTPPFLPFWLRMFITIIRKRLADFFYYWILPLTVGQKPFIGKSSFILRKGDDGLRSCDYNIVYSRRDRELTIRNGVPAEKILILAHPLSRKTTRDFFKRIYFKNQRVKFYKNVKTLTLMYPEEDIGLKRENYSLISKEDLQKIRIKIISLIAKLLKDWKVFIKPHPSTKNVFELKKILASISNCVRVTDPKDQAEKYIEMSKVIVGFSPPSTTLFTASLQSSEKIILLLDLEHQFLGDIYRDFEGINYIDDEKKLIKVLKLIQDNKYQKLSKPEMKLDKGEFSSTIAILEYIIGKKELC